MLSAQSKYAIQALIYLSENTNSDFMRVSDIADQTNLPGPYLSKLINLLAESDIIISKRGKNGGIKLNPDKKELTFYEICEALEDPLVKDECVMFKRPCNKKCPCPFHFEFSKTKQQFLNYLRKTSLS